MRSKLIVMTALALAVGGCHRPDVDHSKSDYTSSLLSRMTPGQIDAATVPPASPDRGPIPLNANAADPATDASLAFANGANRSAPTPDTSPDGQHAAVMAEQAVATAPDTATADEAKRKIYEEYAARNLASVNASRSGMNSSSVNGSSASSSTPNGVSSGSSVLNSASKEPVAQSKASSGDEPVAAQSKASSSNEPVATQSKASSSNEPVATQSNPATGDERMPTENAPKPAS